MRSSVVYLNPGARPGICIHLWYSRAWERPEHHGRGTVAFGVRGDMLRGLRGLRGQRGLGGSATSQEDNLVRGRSGGGTSRPEPLRQVGQTNLGYLVLRSFICIFGVRVFWFLFSFLVICIHLTRTGRTNCKTTNMQTNTTHCTPNMQINDRRSRLQNTSL